MSTNPRSFGGRGVGRNTNPARQQMPTVPISLAKQVKSHEERLYSRFKDLDPEAVRVTRFRSGSLLEEILLKDPNNLGMTHWITSVDAETQLNLFRANAALERAKLRAPVRLGISILDDQTYQALPDTSKRLLLMSQKEYNSFRASQGAQERQTFPKPAQAGSGAELQGSVQA